MRWTITRDLENWQRRFAWFPIKTIDGTWVWLETIERIWYLSPKVTPREFSTCSGINYAYRKLQ